MNGFGARSGGILRSNDAKIVRLAYEWVVVEEI